MRFWREWLDDRRYARAQRRGKRLAIKMHRDGTLRARSPRREDLAAHAVAHVECPDCGEVIPLTLGRPVMDDGDLTVEIQTDDVWAHSWTHEHLDETD